MNRRFTIVTLLLSAAVAFLVGLILAGELTPTPVVSTASGRSRPGDRARSGTSALPMFVNFADVSERINAAVVNIDVSATVGARVTRRPGRPDGEDGGEPSREPETPRPGSGSGFVIDRAGFILTNHHVIEAAQRITVTLADGRSFRAEVVGSDAAIDVALLRIDGATDLPAAPLGNSDNVRVGEWVCAIGNPLGYVHSVTVGVVSFVGRKLYDPSLDDYIQTDAAINVGNSGGPLINTRGEVVGINAAISSRTTSIGFAVPINQAVAVLPQLKSAGRVSRGFIGVTLTDVTPALQRALGLSVSRGAVVQDIGVDSPAERAGLRPYDVVVDIEGRPISGNEELIRQVAARQPGSVARIAVLRDGRRQVLPVKLAERPRRGEEFGGGPVSADTSTVPSPAPAPRSPLGITVRDIDRGSSGRVDVPERIHGVVVRLVDQAGPAYAVLRRGLVIMEINRHAITGLADYARLIATAKPGDVMAIYYYDPALGQRSLVTVTAE